MTKLTLRDRYSLWPREEICSATGRSGPTPQWPHPANEDLGAYVEADARALALAIRKFSDWAVSRGMTLDEFLLKSTKAWPTDATRGTAEEREMNEANRNEEQGDEDQPSKRIATSDDIVSASLDDAARITIVDAGRYPFCAILVAVPEDVAAFFEIRLLMVGRHAVPRAPSLGEWLEFGHELRGSVTVEIGRSGLASPEPQTFRCVFWMRDLQGLLWAEAVGWSNPDGLAAFSAWQGRGGTR